MQTLKVARKKTPRSPLFGSIISPRNNSDAEEMRVDDDSTHEFTNINKKEEFPVINIAKNNSISPRKSKP